MIPGIALKGSLSGEPLVTRGGTRRRDSVQSWSFAGQGRLEMHEFQIITGNHLGRLNLESNGAILTR